LGGHPGEISAAAFSASRDLATLRIATGDVLGNVRLWHYQTSDQTWRSIPVRGHVGGYPITAIKFTPDGRLLTASQDRSVLVHDGTSGDVLPPALQHKGGVKALDVSSDGRRALTLSSPSTGVSRVSLWDLASGAEQSCDTNLRDEPLTSVIFHPNQSVAILTSANASRNSSRFWKWDLHSSQLQELWGQRALRGAIWAASFSNDGSALLAAGGSQARLLTAAQGQLERTFSPHGAVSQAEFSPDDILLATSSLDGDVKLWYADPQHPQYGRVAFKLAQPHGQGAQLYSVAFSPQVENNAYRLVTAGSDGTARLWRFAGGAVTPEGAVLKHGQRVRSALFSPDGQWVLTACDDKKARLWKVSGELPEEPVLLDHQDAVVLFAAFSPDGTRVITGCDDNLAYVWDLSKVFDRRQLATASLTLQGHTAAVTSAAISPDGERAITGSADGIAKLWDLASRKEVLSLKRHGAELTSVHFSPDGSSILTSSLDGLALVWPAVEIGPSVKLSAARREIPREPGLHPLDEQARIFDPDASELAGGTLSAWPASGSAFTLNLIAGQGLEIDGNQNAWLASPAGRKSVALLERPAELPGGLRLRFLPGSEAADAQRLLRAIAVKTASPLTGEHAVKVQISDAGGRASFVAETVVESEEAPVETVASGP
jgi:WD40 repeat protein